MDGATSNPTDAAAPATATAPPTHDASSILNYTDPDAGREAEEQALKPTIDPPLQSLPTRPYLEQTVIPVLMQGLTALSKIRPPDPVEYLAAYLIQHNPNKKESQ
eukprot:TRINITY_DN1688_c0_g1_i2.p1 TRINITY_DN1688_c0_g1~~TRINITY_DN1688_c0_g1_i2.p1  ORF type:complete len:105 (-),score=25.81 TRINITY_DN1688_c0_g1_i2:166-480(-)